jgi:hypothetical protein
MLKRNETPNMILVTADGGEIYCEKVTSIGHAKSVVILKWGSILISGDKFGIYELKQELVIDKYETVSFLELMKRYD